MQIIPQHYILMIEDDPDDRYLTESVFAELGYDISLRLLSAAEEALLFLSGCTDERLPSLIILDKNLPSTDGLQLLKTLKSDERYRHIPVVILSGTAFPAEVSESYSYGASSFIQKPETNQLTTERIAAFIRYWFGIVDLPPRDLPATPSLVLN